MVYQDALYSAGGTYEEGYFQAGYMAAENEERLGKNAREILEALARHVDKGRLLDIGAGPGYYVKAAAGRGWDAHGVEVSRYAAKHAREALGLDVFCGTLEEAQYPDGWFDAAMMVHVVEHLPDPVGTMKELNRVMRKGGALHLSTPNITSRNARRDGASWWALKPGEHLLFFSPDTIKRLLSMTGFEVVEFDTSATVISTESLRGAGLPAGEGLRTFVNSYLKGPKEFVRRAAGRLIQGESINLIAVKK